MIKETFGLIVAASLNLTIVFIAFHFILKFW
jgi:hypothetical protein